MNIKYKGITVNTDKVFFSADHHLGHFAVIGHSNRPFKNIEEMDNYLIEKWNETVPKDGVVFYLGDIAFGRKEEMFEKVYKLNGSIYLVKGNHDYNNILKVSAKNLLFEDIQDVMELKLDVEDIGTIFLSHYAHRTWPRKHYGSFHLYGHSHGSIPPIDRSLDVGVDCWNYRPVSFKEIYDVLKKR